MKASTQTRRISVGGGKGGVGKSIVATNLAVTMARQGHSVTLVDADLGAANLHTLLGVERAAPTLRHYLAGEIDAMAAAAHPTGIPNLHLVAGIGAVPGAPDLSAAQRTRLLEGIATLDDEVVILDVGAGTSGIVVDLFSQGELRLVVLAPQLTSIQNAYAFLKAAIHRSLTRWAETPAQRALVAEVAAAPEAARLGDWIKTAWRTDPEFMERSLRGLDHFGVRLVGNQLFDEDEAGMLQAFARMVREQLRLEAPLIGALCASRLVHDSINLRRPFVLDEAADAGIEVMGELATTLLGEDVSSIRSAQGTAAGEVVELPMADASLPKNFVRFYVRRHRRLIVDWSAALGTPGKSSPVRVREVSLGGALIDLPASLSVGDVCELCFDGLPERPALPVVVRHVRESDRQAGVQFLVEGALPQQVVEAAAARRRRGRARHA